MNIKVKIEVPPTTESAESNRTNYKKPLSGVTNEIFDVLDYKAAQVSERTNKNF